MGLNDIRSSSWVSQGEGLPRPVLLVVGLLLLGMIAFAVGYARGGSGKVDPPPCQGDPKVAQEVTDLMNRGQMASAVDVANLYLTNQQTICAPTKVALSSLIYTATMDDILSTPSADFGHSAAARWQEAEAKAKANGVPANQLMSPLTVMTQAYNAGLWELARDAFLKAWSDHVVGPSDLRPIDEYHATLRNWGVALSTSSDSVKLNQGLTLLATADAISKAYNLGHGEAAADLTKLLGADRSSWPAPQSDDPVLLAAPQ